MADKKDDPKSIDIVDAKEAKLDIGSKPMVVGHKSSIDPTITELPKDEADVATEVQSESAPSKKVRIEPISESVESDTSTSKDTTSNKESAPEDEKQEQAKAETQNEPPAESSDDATKANEEAERDFVAEAENEEMTAQDAEVEREEKVQELKKSKKYFVSIKEKHETAFGKVLAIIFAVLISVVGVYALADAEIIPGGELLPVRFIGEESKNDVNVREVIDSNGVKDDDSNSQDASQIVPTEDMSDVSNTFSSSVLGLELEYPQSLEPRADGLGAEGIPVEELVSVTFGSTDKDVTCCSIVIELAVASENPEGDLEEVFLSGGLRGVAEQSRSINSSNAEELDGKTVSDLTEGTRGEFKTIEFTTTGSYSTGYTEDDLSGTAVDEGDLMNVIFLETDQGIVRIYTSDGDEALTILDSLKQLLQ